VLHEVSGIVIPTNDYRNRDPVAHDRRGRKQEGRHMRDSVAEGAKASGGSITLSLKQREVLDLLLQYKTTKEIARELSISPHTVEQRLRFAREKLGASRRGDLIAAYLRYRSLYEETVYEESPIAASAFPLSQARQPGGESYLVVGHQAPAMGQQRDEKIVLVPAIFMGPTGGLMRVGAVFAIAAAAITVGISGMAMFQELSRILQ
jgi:DNA-binding CsgD family transcriptional regulator